MKAFLPRRGKRTVALDGVDLTVERGEWVSLLGPNGSGKSTLLRVIVGLERLDSGRAIVCGHAAGTSAARRATGVVFQTNSLDGLLTVEENLMLAARLAGMEAGHAHARVRELAETMRLGDRLGHRVRTLSGGLRRRADLARALVHDPEILILDEATTGLDPTARGEFLELLAARRAAQPTTTIIASTHLFEEADRGERVVMMDRGRVVLDSLISGLFGDPSARELRVRGDEDSRHAAGELARLGVNAVSAADGDLVATVATASASTRAALEVLASLGCQFRLSAPTLGDLYQQRTGRPLAPPEGELP